MTYNKNNIFAKIIAGEVAAEILYEDDRIIAVKDINPAAPVHILVMPKGAYIDFADFASKASADEVQHYFKTIDIIAKENDAEEYRIVSNKGEKAGQSVFHFHTHILGGLTNTNLINKNL